MTVDYSKDDTGLCTVENPIEVLENCDTPN